jgi:hypothetical protein
MWRRTYQQLCEQAFEADMVADEAFVTRFERLVTRIENSARQRRQR